MMNCREWERLLDDFVDGLLSAEDRRGAEEHLAECADCAELYEVVKRNRAVLSIRDDDELTDRILKETCGSPCERAHELLLQRLDDTELNAVDSDLLAKHMGHCSPCTVLAADLAWLGETLPVMAEIEPDAAFTADVLRATAEIDEKMREPQVPLFDSILENLKARWQKLYLRPRFSLEAAYVSLIVLVLLCGTPISPLRNAPPRALALVQGGPDALIATLGPDAAVVVDTAKRRARVVWSYSGQIVVGSFNSLSEDIGVRRQRVAPAWQDLQEHTDDLGSAIAELDVPGMSISLGEMGRDLKSVWHEWNEEDEIEQLEQDKLNEDGRTAMPAGSRSDDEKD
ncbi:MAG: zf-HC2 domain-containing protein [bacterium]|nr:zf-HC2 domain-containing protein [bacterium]